MLTQPARAYEIPAKPAARVNDYAGILDPRAQAAIEEKLAEFERQSSTQIVVATIPSLDGDAIEDVALRAHEKWGLGQKDKNNGILLLIAAVDRRARIEVGYGLEDRLTDALSRRILEERLFPAFRKNDYALGISAACDGIIEATQGAYAAAPKKRRGKSAISVLVPLAIIILFILMGQGGSGISGRGRRRYYRSGPFWWGAAGGLGGSGWGGGSGGGFGGGGGGGFGGFSGGGGMSGGGGASGSW